MPLDEQRQWYRFHDLFREALRARLQASQPELVPLLHTRAARWYAEVRLSFSGYTSSIRTAERQVTGERRHALHYRIRVKGHLDPAWQEWLEGLQIEHETDGTSLLIGTLIDQPALYGVLLKIAQLSLTLLSLESSANDTDEA